MKSSLYIGPKAVSKFLLMYILTIIIIIDMCYVTYGLWERGAGKRYLKGWEGQNVQNFLYVKLEFSYIQLSHKDRVLLNI